MEFSHSAKAKKASVAVKIKGQCCCQVKRGQCHEKVLKIPESLGLFYT